MITPAAFAALAALADQGPPLPAPDRFGIPGHYAIFLFLYHLTFVLHLLFMNFALGGSILCFVNDLRCLLPFNRRRSRLIELNRRISRAMPVAVSFAITFGVAPLLFVQVLYGQFFYTANILLGLPWLGVVGVLMATFYVVYVLSLRCTGAGACRTLARVILSGFVASGFIFVAYMFTLNASWSINPQQWLSRYDAASHSASLLSALRPPAADLHFWPRLAHNLIGATAVACVLVAVLARVLLRRGAIDHASAHGAVRGCLGTAAVLTLLQAAAGVGILIHLRPGPRSRLIDVVHYPGLIQAWGWRIAAIFSAALCLILLLGALRPRKALLTWASLVGVIVVLAGMSMGREALRAAYLAELAHFDLASTWTARVTAQGGAMLMFAATLVAGLAVIGWLLWWVWRLPAVRDRDVADRILDVVGPAEPELTVPPLDTSQLLTPTDADLDDPDLQIDGDHDTLPT